MAGRNCRIYERRVRQECCHCKSSNALLSFGQTSKCESINSGCHWEMSTFQAKGEAHSCARERRIPNKSPFEKWSLPVELTIYGWAYSEMVTLIWQPTDLCRALYRVEWCVLLASKKCLRLVCRPVLNVVSVFQSQERPNLNWELVIW